MTACLNDGIESGNGSEALIGDVLTPPQLFPGGNLEIPPATVIQSQAAGTLPGHMSVSPGGKALYSVALAVPQGRAGIQPRLAISFGGGTRNGMLGVGWTLNGLSRISPCRKTVAQDGSADAIHFRSGDEYCMDGRRLIAVNGAPGAAGTEYRLEQDRFIKLESLGVATGAEFSVPASFVAHRPNGQTWTYDKRILTTRVTHQNVRGDSPSTQEVVWSWLLARIEDPSGNAMNIEYDHVDPPASRGTGGYDDRFATEFYPRRIRYTSNTQGLAARRSVEFFYEARPDAIDTYVSGIHHRLAKRLARVQMNAPFPSQTREVWSYELAYKTSSTTGRSLLDSIRRCDASGTCLPATTFGWSVGGDSYVKEQTGISEGSDPIRQSSLITADFNGDGRSDVLYWDGRREYCECADAACTEIAWDAAGDSCNEVGTFHVEGRWRIAYGNDRSLAAVRDAGLGANWSTRLEQPAQNWTSTSDEYNPPLVADFDGDGAADILASRSGEIRSPARGGALLQDVASTYRNLPPFWEPDIRFLGDLDGDGRADLFTNTNRPTPIIRSGTFGDEITGWTGPNDWDQYTWAYRLSTANPGFAAARNAPIRPFMQRFDPHAAREIVFKAIDPQTKSLAMDIDGDGRTELALPVMGNRYRQLEVASDGSPIITDINLSYMWPGGVGGIVGYGAYEPIYLDINGDGLRDVVAANGATVDASGALALPARINTGNGFGPWYLALSSGYIPSDEQRTPEQIRAEGSAPMSDNGIRVIDANSDGLQDLLVPTAAGPVIYESNGRTFHSRPASFELATAIGETMDGRARFLGWSHRVADVNGDGMADIVQYDASRRQLVVLRHTGSASDRLIWAKNGLGRVESVTRDSMVEPKAYTPGSGCLYPQRCLHGGGQVVTLLERTNAEGNLDLYQYEYKDARADVTGRGFLGFGTRIERDLLRERVTTTTRGIGRRWIGFYPLTGFVLSQRTETRIDGTHTRVETLDRKPTIRGEFGNRVWYARALEETRRVYEFTGTVGALVPSRAKRESRSIRRWNGYGQLTREDVRVRGRSGPVAALGDRTVTQHIYANRAASWQLGLEIRTKTTSYAAPDRVRRETRQVYSNYDSSGRLIRVVDTPDDPALGLKTRWFYGAYGELARVSRENLSGAEVRNDRFTYGVEALFPVTYTNALGHQTQLAVHPAFGALIKVTDANGFGYDKQIDGFGRERHTAVAGGYQTWTDYERGATGGYLERQRSNNGAEATAEYKPSGHLWRTRKKAFDGRWATREMGYDSRGNVESTTNSFVSTSQRRTTNYSYDGLGRLVRIQHPDGGVEKIRPGIDEARSWDPAGNETYLRFDVNGRMADSTSVATDGGATRDVRTRYSYGVFGQLEAVAAPAGSVRRMSYDHRGRLISLEDPAIGLRTKTYNAFGELVGSADPVARAAGRPTIIHRDLLGRVTARESIDGTDTYTWDSPAPATGGTPWVGARMASTSADGIGTRAKYDRFGRVVSRGTFADGRWYDVDYRYNAASQLAEIHYPSVPGRSRFGIRLNYGVNGQLRQLMDINSGASLWQAFARNSDGRVTSERSGSKLYTSRTFDPNTGLPTRILGRAKVPSYLYPRFVPRFDYKYGYDTNGRLSTLDETVAGRHDSFTYDSLSHIASWKRQKTGNYLYATNYSYDDAGNLTSRYTYGGWSSMSESFDRGSAVGNPNALTKYTRSNYGYVSATTSMSYDLNGRRVSGPWNSIDYTAYDRPKSVTKGGRTTKYEHNADGTQVVERAPTGTTVRIDHLYERRVTAGATKHTFIVPADEGVVAQFEYDEGTRATTPHFMHRDRLGSTAVETDKNGTLTKQQWFTPFGLHSTDKGIALYSTSPAAEVIPGFTGHRGDDALGFIDMGGRVYDPIGAGFLTPDPIVAQPANGQSYNGYAYVRNNPLNLTDPTGLQAVGDDISYPFDDSLVGTETRDEVGNRVVTFSAPEDAAASDQAESDSAEHADDTSTTAAHELPPPSGVFSKTESLRFDFFTFRHIDMRDTWGCSMSHHCAEFDEFSTVPFASVTLRILYTRNTSGHREARVLHASAQTRTSEFSPSIAISTQTLRIGESPRIDFQITLRSADNSVSNTSAAAQNSSRLSGTAGIEAPGVKTGISVTGPSSSRSTSTTITSSIGSQYVMTGSISIPVEAGEGPRLLARPTLPTDARLHTSMATTNPNGASVTSRPIAIFGPFWTVESINGRPVTE